MPFSIVLRTVCGCERLLDIPNPHLPPIYRVPYIRRPNWHAYSLRGEDFSMPMDHNIRTFERTGATGQYGYPVYLEKI